MINLTPRLLKTAELITPCKKLADIGTDHAYIPVYALQNDLAETVVASDINEGPLNNAAKTVSFCPSASCLATQAELPVPEK